MTKWRLEVGTNPGGKDLFLQGMVLSITSMLVSGLPTDGNPVYVTLKWRIAGVVGSASFTYTASTGGVSIRDVRRDGRCRGSRRVVSGLYRSPEAVWIVWIGYTRWGTVLREG